MIGRILILLAAVTLGVSLFGKITKHDSIQPDIRSDSTGVHNRTPAPQESSKKGKDRHPSGDKRSSKSRSKGRREAPKRTRHKTDVHQ